MADAGNGRASSAAGAVGPLLDALAPGVAVRVELWDGSAVGPAESPTVRLRSPDALRRLLWAPGELGLGRAYVAGDIDLEGDVFATIAALRPAADGLRLRPRQVGAILAATKKAGAIGPPLPPPPEEARPRGLRHSLRRDVGCGWGSMAIHAAGRYGAKVVGVTISREQRELAQRRVAEAGLAESVEIRLQDYREVRGERFDAISSIGMSEHVGSERIDEYFAVLAALLAPEGRLLNHAISSVGGSKLSGRSFMGRYVFPDGELLDVADTVSSMQRAGLEVRDVQSLREHYAQTLRAWVANLEQRWDEAVQMVGERRTRVWRLYMGASAVGFEDNGLAVHQVLGVSSGREGSSGMPLTRARWVTSDDAALSGR